MASQDSAGDGHANDPQLSIDLLCARNLLDSSWAVMYFKDRQSRFIRVSRDCALVNHRTQEEMIGLTDFDLTDYDHALSLYEEEQRIIETGLPVIDKEEADRLENQPGTWVETSKFPLRDADGNIVGTFGISRDVTRREVAERRERELAQQAIEANAAAARAESQLRAVLEGASDAIAQYDASLRYKYINPAGERLRGMTRVSLLGRSDRESGMSERLLAQWEPALRVVLATGRSHEVELHYQGATPQEDAWLHASLAPDRNQAGTVIGVFASTRDISALKRAEHVLAHQAMHDSLTGLANRHLLIDRVSHSLRRRRRSPENIALLFVDLDHFKDINDAHGHAIGDKVLVDVAHRLEAVARHGDTVARIGGDEFVILLDGDLNQTDVGRIAARCVDVFARPFSDGDVTLPLSASVGAAITEDSNIDASTLLKQADSAMYQAKAGGRHRYEFFDPKVARGEGPEPSLATELSQALASHQLKLVYQPRVTLHNREILGFEALLRWDHPVRGVLEPRDFLGIAEAQGLSVSIGAWVLDTACAQIAQLTLNRRAEDSLLVVAVNVSASQLRHNGFPNLVTDALKRHKVAPTQLCLEISEHDLAMEGPHLRDTLSTLAAAGVQLAVDNFGATYASLTRLPQFPIGLVKFDTASQDLHERRLASRIVEMAHGLGMRVVGQRIETPDQLSDLESASCDDGQGFLLGYPVEPAEAERMVTSGTKPDASDAAQVRGTTTEDSGDAAKHAQGQVQRTSPLGPSDKNPISPPREVDGRQP